MSRPIGRSDLIRGALHAKFAPFRPPWSIPEPAFTDACTRCDDCLTVCPESILVHGRGGFPETDFHKGGCSFCGDCAQACRTGALSRTAGPWRLSARVAAKSCLSMKGVACRVCEDRCEAGAITFTLAAGARAAPGVALPACTGCGGCVAPCPAGAIEMFHPVTGEHT